MIGGYLLGGLFIIQAVRWWRMAAVADKPMEAGLSGEPSVTFLVGAWNAEEDIREFIESFQSLRLGQKQLVLVAGGSDNTFHVASSEASENIIVIEQLKGEGKQKALAKGLTCATGDLVYLTDIDCRLTEKAVYPLVQYVTDHPNEVATGRVRPLGIQQSQNFVLMQWAIRQKSDAPDGASVGGIDGRNAVVARKILEKSQVFAVSAPSGTDYTLAKELLQRGWSIRQIATSEMETEFPPNFRVYVRKQARWLRNVVVLGQRYGSRNEVLAVGITLAFPWIVGLFAAGGFFNAFLFWVASLLVAYAVTSRILYLRLLGCPQAVLSAVSVLIGDWAAALLALRHLLRHDYRWS